MRNTRRGPSRGVKRCIGGRGAGEEAKGKEDRQRYLERVAWRTIRGIGKPPRDIARVGELCLLCRSFVRSLLAGEITEESYAHFTSHREKGNPVLGVADNSVSEPRSHCHHLPFFASFSSSFASFSSVLPPLPLFPSCLSSLSAALFAATLVFPRTSVTLARGADIKSNLAQWVRVTVYRIFRGSMPFISAWPSGADKRHRPCTKSLSLSLVSAGSTFYRIDGLTRRVGRVLLRTNCPGVRRCLFPEGKEKSRR